MYTARCLTLQECGAMGYGVNDTMPYNGVGGELVNTVRCLTSQL